MGETRNDLLDREPRKPYSNPQPYAGYPSVTPCIVINIPTRELLAGETVRIEHFNNKKYCL